MRDPAPVHQGDADGEPVGLVLEAVLRRALERVLDVVDPDAR
ncbi:hypothetical protein [Streptomyces sp. NPDC058735]